jgi:gamma-glutamyltranspeptidase/glutathione hydrolase
MMKALRLRSHMTVGCAMVCRTLIVLLMVVQAMPASAAEPGGAAIASAHPLATRAGLEILTQGGNAFDAAVAVAASLAVVEPYSSGLGGGGFFLLHRASDRRQVMVDARETAPSGVTREQYYDVEGRPLRHATTEGGTSVGVPGMPAGLVHLAERYGRLPLTQSLAPAVKLAREGFPLDPRFARIARLREAVLQRNSGGGVYLNSGKSPDAGFMLRQPALAGTLERLARDGRDGFYRGPVAQQIVAAVNAQGATWRPEDMSDYRVIEREPLVTTYRGAKVTTATLPSGGGVSLVQSLRMLERYSLTDSRDPATAHLVAEALRRAFHDRARHLGDPDQTRIPVGSLLDGRYLEGRAASIDARKATPSSSLTSDASARAESYNTTHFSVIDEAGNRVAATLSINWLFGSAIMAGDTGVLLNNEMDDFTLRADVANSYRLMGSAANAIAPGRRPLSSMTPTFVEKNGAVLIVGAPGGSRIVSQVLLGVLDFVHAGVAPDLDAIVGRPRYHHQYLPDVVEIEPEGFTTEWMSAMAALGHEVRKANRLWGNVQLVYKPAGGAPPRAVSDPRGSDIAWY